MFIYVHKYVLFLYINIYIYMYTTAPDLPCLHQIYVYMHTLLRLLLLHKAHQQINI